MKLLIVEDDSELVASFNQILRDSEGIDLKIAENRDDAMAVIESADFFDLIVCDLRIPTSGGAIDANAIYGTEVFERAKVLRPGTPIWICAGFAEDDFVNQLLENARRGDPFGSGSELTIHRHFNKGRLAEMVGEIKALNLEIGVLDSIEIERLSPDSPLEVEQRRILRVFARLHGATVVNVRTLKGGLSGAQVFAVQAVDSNDASVLNCIVKVGDHKQLMREAGNYRSLASILNASGFAPLIGEIYFGGGRVALHWYSIVSTNSTSLAELFSSDVARSLLTVEKLKQRLSVLRETKVTERLPLNQFLIGMGAPDLDEARAMGLDIDAAVAAQLGTLSIQYGLSIQHGDLHPWNVLLDDSDAPILIDYGRVAKRSSSYDALMIELGVVLHPDAAEVLGEWPTVDQCSHWDDVDIYMQGCPCETALRFCREWAREEAAASREFLGAALSIVLWHLNFPIGRDRALAIAHRLVELLSDAT